MRYRFESSGASGKRSRSKESAGENRLLLLGLIIGLPASMSLLVLLLSAPAATPKSVAPKVVASQPAPFVLATPVVLARLEPLAAATLTPTPAVASQPRTAIAVLPDGSEDVPPDDDLRCEQRHLSPNLWCVEFFADRDQIGDPVWREVVQKLDYNFGRGEPRPNVLPDNFKMVAIGNFTMDRLDSYVYDMIVDGGARLWIDNQLVIDEWQMWKRRTRRVRVPLLPATHLLRVEYYDNKGAALLRLRSSISHDVHHNWLGRYYNNNNLEGLPAMIREDVNLNFVWPLNPGQPVNNDDFSAQWVRILDVPAAGFDCTLLADDRARVYVDGDLVDELNSWDAPNMGPQTVKLNAGRRFVEVHYAEFAGEARINFTCEPIAPAY